MSDAQNHLIELLQRKDRRRLVGLCELVTLDISTVLCERGSSLQHAYFPVDGYISLIAQQAAEHGIEVGMVGRESMLGVEIALGVAKAPIQATVQGQGTAWRIGIAALRKELANSAPLQDIVNRCTYVMLTQLASSAICLHYHRIRPRLARWLLMTQDRAHSSQFPVTQEGISCMMGVRRVGISNAASILQSDGLIEYHRGHLRVLDRTGLVSSACDCYVADCEIYDEVLK